jgi:uncharacterized membrane protein
MAAETDGAIPIVPTTARARLQSIDLLRGIIMVLMALDHVRDFFSHDLHSFFPLDLEKTYPALFLTRWITHFCAPVFCFLAGTGAFLSSGRGKTKNQLAWFLVSRGLWLVFLELTVVRCFGWSFEFSYRFTGLAVIWALGWSMVALAALIYLPRWLIATFAVVMIAGHNLTDRITPEAWGSLGWLWTILHASGPIAISSRVSVFAAYPLVPWIGVMALGYVFGTVFQLDPPARQRRLLWCGFGITAAFVVIRGINIYGDPHPWSAQPTLLFTVFSFIKCEKYPPSLLYLLMTLGPSIIALALLERARGKWAQPFVVVGRVPLFFYLLHLPLIHGLAVALSYARYGRAEWLLGGGGPPGVGPQPPADAGYGLLGVYVIWFAIVLALYPACAWFARLKQQRRDPWLSYL